MHTFIVRVLEKSGPVITLEAMLAHPDIETFGTERHFAWKLLSDFVSPEDDADDVTLARRLIERVEVGPLRHGTVTERGPGWFKVARDSDDEDAELPTVAYTLWLSDASLVDAVEVGDSEESVAYVETDKVILDEPADAPVWRRLECTEGGSSKFWQGRVDGSKLHVRWGKLGTEGRTQEDDWLSPERAEKAFAKLVAEKLKKGYVEVAAAGASAAGASTKEAASARGKGAKAKGAKATPKEAEPPPSPKKAGKSKSEAAEPAALAPKTYDDLRAAVFELVRTEARNPPDELIACVVRWAEGASDAQVSAWLEELRPKDHGWFSEAAGRVAAQRAIAGDEASARRFLTAGEQALPTEDPSDRARATVGLMGAWWRLGEAAKADAAWAALPADPASYVSEKGMAWAAALGGQVDRFVAVGEIGSMFDFATVEGLLALHADGVEVFADAIERCEEKSASAELAEGLLRRALAAGRPRDFLELALRFPQVLVEDAEACVVVALEALSKLDAAAAIELALRVLADEDTFSFGYMAHPQAFALLARLDHAQAQRWAEGCDALEDEGLPSRHAYMAALGRTDEVRAALAGLTNLGVFLGIAASTPDRALAAEALRAYVEQRRKKLGEIPVWALARLCDLGERAFVDALLEGELARLEALPPKDRDSGCRALCLRAASLGRLDLARRAQKLPTKGVRYCSVQEIVRGCAGVRDHAGVLAGLELFDERRYVLDAAIMSLRVIEAAFVNGPRAMPFGALVAG